MRTITADQKQAIEDLSAQGLLRNLPIQTAEKDVHITELLKALSELRVEHGFFSDMKRGEGARHDLGVQLVFAGGTCLSKAHGLIHRMSEDIDLKVVLTPPEKPFSKGRGDRARLKVLHQMLPGLLESLGFPLLNYPNEEENPRVLNAHRYYSVGARYQSAYGQLPSLRPELKLEVIHRHPQLPCEPRTFGYLYESMAGLKPSSPVTISCISIAETTAEKVLSLLRRSAWSWDGREREELDPALVRHIYDVARIVEAQESVLEEARAVFPVLVLADRDELEGQHPEYDKDPVVVLKRALGAARTNGVFEARYAERLLPLVYEVGPPGFSQVFKTFEAVAVDFLDACRGI